MAARKDGCGELVSHKTRISRSAIGPHSLRFSRGDDPVCAGDGSCTATKSEPDATGLAARQLHAPPLQGGDVLRHQRAPQRARTARDAETGARRYGSCRRSDPAGHGRDGERALRRRITSAVDDEPTSSSAGSARTRWRAPAASAARCVSSVHSYHCCDTRLVCRVAVARLHRLRSGPRSSSGRRPHGPDPTAHVVQSHAHTGPDDTAGCDLAAQPQRNAWCRDP